MHPTPGPLGGRTLMVNSLASSSSSGASIGLSTPQHLGTAGGRTASSLSAAKQERLDALRSERLRIMQAQASMLARPRSAARSGTPNARTAIATPPPLEFRGDSEEVTRLKGEIKQLKISEELAKEKLTAMEAEKLELEKELSSVRGGSVGSAELAKMKLQLSREKERVFVLSTEKQKLEEELHELQVERFQAERLRAELDGLRRMAEKAAHWEEEKVEMAAKLVAVKRENEALQRLVQQEKSQRLVAVGKLEELEKRKPDGKGEVTFERRPTVVGADSGVGGGVTLPGVVPVVERDGVASHFQMDDGLVGGEAEIEEQEEEKEDMIGSFDISTPPKAVPESLWQAETVRKSSAAEMSFIDVEQRGSAKRTPASVGMTVSEIKPLEKRKSSPDLADIFGPSSPERKNRTSSQDARNLFDQSMAAAATGGQHIVDQPDVIHQPQLQPQLAPQQLPQQAQQPQQYQQLQQQPQQNHVRPVYQEPAFVPHQQPPQYPTPVTPTYHATPTGAYHPAPVNNQFSSQPTYGQLPQQQRAPPAVPFQSSVPVNQGQFQQSNPGQGFGAAPTNAYRPATPQRSWPSSSGGNPQYASGAPQIPKAAPQTHSLIRNNNAPPARMSPLPSPSAATYAQNTAPPQPVHPAFAGGRSPGGARSPQMAHSIPPFTGQQYPPQNQYQQPPAQNQYQQPPPQFRPAGQPGGQNMYSAGPFRY